MDVTFLSRAAQLFPARRARNISLAWSQCLKDGIEPCTASRVRQFIMPVTAVDAPYSAAGANVYVVNAFAVDLASRRTSSLK